MWKCSSLHDSMHELAVRLPSRTRCLKSPWHRAKSRVCVSLQDFQSLRDPQLFYVHSRWKDEAAFENHAQLPHTVRFIERVEPLIDHPLDVARTKRIGWCGVCLRADR